MGEVIMRRIVKGVLGCDLAGMADHQLEVVQADPHIHVTDELLCDLGEHLRHPWHLVKHCTRPMRLEPPAGAPPPVPWVDWHDHDLDANPWPCQPYLTTPDHRYRCWHNWLLHIDATNRKLIYRIGQYQLATNTWSASWPD